MGEKENLFSIFCPPLSLLIRHTFPFFRQRSKGFFSFSKRETKTADLIDLWAGCGAGFDKVEAMILTIIVSPRNKNTKNINTVQIYFCSIVGEFCTKDTRLISAAFSGYNSGGGRMKRRLGFRMDGGNWKGGGRETTFFSEGQNFGAQIRNLTVCVKGTNSIYCILFYACVHL